MNPQDRNWRGAERRWDHTTATAWDPFSAPATPQVIAAVTQTNRMFENVQRVYDTENMMEEKLKHVEPDDIM